MIHKKRLPQAISYQDDFPILINTNRGRPLIYLDSAATSQKPQQVIDAIHHYYCHDNANIHRGVYELSERATRKYEDTRKTVKQFINAASADEIVFVSGTTEGINLVAQTLGRHFWQAGDEVILSAMEHHSNIVPWYLLKEQIGVVLKVVPINDAGELDIDVYKQLFSARTKMVALTHVSNVLGTINPVKELITIAHEYDVPVLLDGAQAAPHIPIDVQALDCDFYLFSSHKLYGPTGIGILYGKIKWLELMPPHHGGGDMIETVAFEKVTYAKAPQKFEAGTPNIAGVIGLDAAIHYVQAIGFDAIMAHEKELTQYTHDALSSIAGVRLIGTAKERLGVFSFVMDGIHPHDIGTIVDHEGIAIRVGHHCAMPLMQHYQVPATARASLGIYNQKSDIDALVSGLQIAKRLFL